MTAFRPDHYLVKIGPMLGSAATADSTMTALQRFWPRIVYLFLLLMGIGLLGWSGYFDYVRPAEVVLGAAGVLVGVIPPFARACKRFADRLNALSPEADAVIAVILLVLLPIHFLIAAWRGGRPLVPLMHDEQMYLVQARQLASFRLAMPPLPHGDFFETFYVFVKPVYASMYFPGTALAYVPSIWLGLPYCAWPLLVMTLLCVMTYLVAGRIVGRFLGLVAVFVMLAAGPMNWMPTASMSHPLGALCGMTMLYAWIRWRATRRIGWALLLGAAAGQMAITRPLESLVFGLPILIAICCATRLPTLAKTVRHAAAAVACTLPFLALQLATDHAVTGNWLTLPVSLYNQQEFPGLGLMGRETTDFQVTSTLPEKKGLMKSFLGPQLKRQANATFWSSFTVRTNFILFTGLACPLLFIILPLSLARLRVVEIRLLWAIFISFAVAYSIYGMYVTQYSSQMMPLLAILVVAGASGLTADFPRRAAMSLGGYCGGVIGVIATTLCIMTNNGLGNDFSWDVMLFNYDSMPRIVHKPALVMYRYGEKSSPFIEPVYNLDTAWPDDADVIRVHDFGPKRDLELFRYYAAFQPDRNVYVFDRDLGNLKSLGTVATLVRQADAATQPAAK